MPHIAYHIPCCHHAALLQPLRIGVVLPQVSIIIVPLPVEATDADTPAAVLVPPQSSHHTGLHRHNRRTHQPHHVMSQMLPLVTIAPSYSKVIIMCIIKATGQREIALQPILLLISRIARFVYDLLLIFSHQSPNGGIIGFLVIRKILHIGGHFLQRLFALGNCFRRLFHGLQRAFFKFSASFGCSVSQKVHPAYLIIRSMGFHIPFIGHAQCLIRDSKIHPFYVIIFHGQHMAAGDLGLLPRLSPKCYCHYSHGSTFRQNCSLDPVPVFFSAAPVPVSTVFYGKTLKYFFNHCFPLRVSCHSNI